MVSGEIPGQAVVCRMKHSHLGRTAHRQRPFGVSCRFVGSYPSLWESGGVTDKGKSCEEDWAGLFDKLGLHYEYEPTLFEFPGTGYGFCPDFYFPEHNVYVEVTVTRHIGRKNKKLRAVREMHPEATFILLTRHEHDYIFGENPMRDHLICEHCDDHITFHKHEIWTQIAVNLALLLESLFDLPEPLTAKAA